MPETPQPNALSLPFVEALYVDFLADPESVPEAWRRYFEELGPTNGSASHPQLVPSFPRQALFGVPKPARPHGAANGDAESDGFLGTFLAPADGSGPAGAIAAATDRRGVAASADADF